MACTWMGYLFDCLESGTGNVDALRINEEVHGGKVPRIQIEAWWEDFAPICHQRLSFSTPRGVSALNTEPQKPADRCKYKSPDGRGLAWLNSGGSGLTYGRCCKVGCPLLKEGNDNAAPKTVGF